MIVLKKIYTLIVVAFTIIVLTSCSAKFNERQQLTQNINKGNITAVREYFTKNPEEINKPIGSNFESEFGVSSSYPLHQACITQNLDMIKMLIEEFNADVNLIDDLQYTPLIAVFNYHFNREIFSVIDYLINKGADIHYVRNEYSVIDYISNRSYINDKTSETKAILLIDDLYKKSVMISKNSYVGSMRWVNLDIVLYILQTTNINLTDEDVTNGLYECIETIHRKNTDNDEENDIIIDETKLEKFELILKELSKHNINLQYVDDDEITMKEMLDEIQLYELRDLIYK